MKTHMATVGVKGLKLLPVEATMQQGAVRDRIYGVEFEYRVVHLLHAMLILW